MNRDERNHEVERLLAILEGDGEPMEIIENGTVVPVEEAMAWCKVCHVGLVCDEIYVIEGVILCHECGVEFMVGVRETIQRTYPEWRDKNLVRVKARDTCPTCGGKCLLFDHAATPKWQHCSLCEGKGALTAWTLIWRAADV
jgi:hypothetical protein